MIPNYIAICGNPNSGKSTAANLISEIYGHVVADDGRPLREIAHNYLGLTHDQVYTQEGKKQMVEVNDRKMEAREVLGILGYAFEDKFGEDVIPLMALNAHSHCEKIVLGSVRRNQTLFWSKRGALVLEISNPLALPSPFAFDAYNREGVSKVILNDGLHRGLAEKDAREDLKAKIIEAIGEA